jgi:hypothetical protein
VLSDIPQVECHFLKLMPFCSPVKHFGRAEPMSEHLAVNLCVISGSDEWLAPVVGPIDGTLNRPVEPLSFGFGADILIGLPVGSAADGWLQGYE